MLELRRRRDPAPGQALQEARPGQLGRAQHRRVHVAAGAAAEPARPARHRHLRRGRQRRGGLQGVHPGRVPVQREGRQAVQAEVCVPNIRHGQRRVHLERGAVSGAKDDGGQQPERHPAAADRRQDHCVRRQGRGRQNFLRGVLLGGGQHRHPQKDGRRRLRGADLGERYSLTAKQKKITYYTDIQVRKKKKEGKTTNTHTHTHSHTHTYIRVNTVTLLIASKEIVLFI